MNPSYKTGHVLFSTNLYGIRSIDEALNHLLTPSSLTIYVSSEVGVGATNGIQSSVRQQLEQASQLTWDTIYSLAEDFLHSLDGPSSPTKYQWRSIAGTYGAYGMSKALLNYYARARYAQHPEKHLVMVTPGYCATELNGFRGPRSTEVGALSIIDPINNEGEIKYAHFYRDGQQLEF